MNLNRSIDKINKLDKAEFNKQFFYCCGSTQWVKQLENTRPFKNKEELLATSDSIWKSLSEKDYLEAFCHHPKIGDIDSLKKKFKDTAQFTENEQKGTSNASEQTLLSLQTANTEYAEKFGFIFIVCATGKSAEQMLEMLNQRLKNNRNTELQIAAEEQNRITVLRIYKLLTQYFKDDENQIESMMDNKNSDITTHVLDTALGKPAAGISTLLEYQLEDGSWIDVASGITNNDGRIMSWMNKPAKPGYYKITFDIYDYHNGKGFFPKVSINFRIEDDNQHYHVPLLLSPFSYSTYRGS